MVREMPAPRELSFRIFMVKAGHRKALFFLWDGDEGPKA